MFIPWVEKITGMFPEKADLLIAFDCADQRRTGIQSPIETVNIDHHSSNTGFGDYNLIRPEALSTTEVVYDWFVAEGIKINAKMATALYAGLIWDTRSFRNLECGPETFEKARSLLASGADHGECVRRLFETRSLASARLVGRMLQRMKIVADGKIAVLETTQTDLDETGATMSEAKYALEEAMKLATVSVALLIVNLGNSQKISVRTDGNVSAVALAAVFGGGGHLERAGADVTGTDPQIIIEQIMSMVKKEKM